MALALLFMAIMTRQAHRLCTVRQLVLSAALAAGLFTGSGCHPNADLVSISSAAIGGTIAGVVTGPADATLADRTVTIVNVETGERYQTATGEKGGYALRVPPGRYRLDVQLPRRTTRRKGTGDSPQHRRPRNHQRRQRQRASAVGEL